MSSTPTTAAAKVLEHQALGMRHKLLALAADFDRIQRAPGGDAVLRDDPQIRRLREAAALLVADEPDRAAALQMKLSDLSEVGA